MSFNELLATFKVELEAANAKSVQLRAEAADAKALYDLAVEESASVRVEGEALAALQAAMNDLAVAVVGEELTAPFAELARIHDTRRIAVGAQMLEAKTAWQAAELKAMPFKKQVVTTVKVQANYVPAGVRLIRPSVPVQTTTVARRAHEHAKKEAIQAIDPNEKVDPGGQARKAWDKEHGNVPFLLAKQDGIKVALAQYPMPEETAAILLACEW